MTVAERSISSRSCVVEDFAALGVPPVVPSAQSRTILLMGDVICAFGISSPWPGLGFAWCEERDTLSMQCYGLSIKRCIKRYWGQWITEEQYARIECRAPVARPNLAIHRLVSWLGFTEVCDKPGYGRAGETMREYVWYPSEGARRVVAREDSG